nr:Transposase IS4 family protein [Streptomyces sp. F8]
MCGQEEENAEHRRVRARVAHTFARLKNWKSFRDCRPLCGGSGRESGRVVAPLTRAAAGER